MNRICCDDYRTALATRALEVRDGVVVIPPNGFGRLDRFMVLRYCPWCKARLLVEPNEPRPQTL